MTPTERILQLQKEIEIERKKIQNCSHSFAPTEYDPEETLVPYGSRTVAYGSDVYSEPEGYEKKNIPRWSRTCRTCGYKQYTTKQSPVISSYEPDFN